MVTEEQLEQLVPGDGVYINGGVMLHVIRDVCFITGVVGSTIALTGEDSFFGLGNITEIFNKKQLSFE